MNGEEPAPTVPTVFQALSAVMGDVQSVGKTGKNTKQNYSFRGIDATVNAVGPALRAHGVIIVPVAEDMTVEHYATSGGTQMRSVTLKIRWRIYGPAGDSIEAVTYGEASDSGDKGVPKAHSVAYRTALLQALCIPTDEPDPDESSYERAAVAPSDPALVELNAATNAVKNAFQAHYGTFSADLVASNFAEWSGGEILREATAARLRAYSDALSDGYTPDLPTSHASRNPEKN